MLSICLIVLFSVVLFVYWFRYSCLLILQNRTAFSPEYANGSALSFPAVQERLRAGETGVDLLDQLHRDLSNDYRIICFLLRCSTENGVDPIERRLLMLDYWIMQGWFAVARQMSPLQARKALEEMSNIVSYFACSVGRHAPQNAGD
jgi:hypothetical protein